MADRTYASFEVHPDDSAPTKVGGVMRITFEIETDNDAFHGDRGPGHEVRRILARWVEEDAYHLDHERTESVRDINGNTVGKVTVTP